MKIPLRSLLQALSMFGGSINELKKFVDEHEGKFHSVFDFDFINPKDPMYGKNLLLETRLESLDVEIFYEQDLDEEKIVAAYAALPRNHPKLTEILSSKDHRKFLARFLKHSFCLQQFGFRYESNGEALHFGNVLRPLSLMLNTSCVPNLGLVTFEGDKTAWVVTRPVKAGDQLFRTYIGLENWMKQPTRERRAAMMDRLGFVCDCEACTNGFDQKLFEMPEGTKDIKIAKKSFAENCKYINKNSAKEILANEVKLKIAFKKRKSSSDHGRFRFSHAGSICLLNKGNAKDFTIAKNEKTLKISLNAINSASSNLLFTKKNRECFLM